MPKFKWGVTLVMERQKCVPLIIEAETLEEAKKRILKVFSNSGYKLDRKQFKAMFPDISLEHDEFDERFVDSWNECDVYGWDNVATVEESA